MYAVCSCDDDTTAVETVDCEHIYAYIRIHVKEKESDYSVPCFNISYRKSKPDIYISSSNLKRKAIFFLYTKLLCKDGTFIQSIEFFFFLNSRHSGNNNGYTEI